MTSSVESELWIAGDVDSACWCGSPTIAGEVSVVACG